MASITERRSSLRQRRHRRVRLRVAGTAQRPRLAVFRSLRHIYAQLIDDETARTLVSASTREAALAGELAGKDKTDRAAVIGRVAAERAREAGIETVIFDRGGFRYHGRVSALAKAAREAGLQF
jgi:large subunit ribosomal protein L18